MPSQRRAGCVQPHHLADRRGLEQGVRPWVKPWNAEHAAGRITRPLRYNGQPYSGINILSLWCVGDEQGSPPRSG